MRKMGLMAVYQKPKTSQPHPQHKTYPYLLRGKAITRPNQVWCADITYIPMRRGFLYLVAIMDWHIPKEPFLKWVQSTDAEAADIPDESILSYSCMYLVDDSLDGDDPEKLTKKNFEVIFEEELAGWYKDEEAWPKKMDLRVVKQWVHVKVH